MTLLFSLLACSPNALCLEKEGYYEGVDDNGVTWGVAVTTTSENFWRDNNYNLELGGQIYSPEMTAPLYKNLFAATGPEVDECRGGDNAFDGRLDSDLDDNDWQEEAVDDGWVMTGDWAGSVNEDQTFTATYTMNLVSDTGETVDYSGDVELAWGSIENWY